MPSATNPFIWYELMTTDTAAATAFYRAVIGWQAQDAGTPGIDYTILSSALGPVGGLMALPAHACEAGARPAWSGYIAVDDVDAYVGRVTAAGGGLHLAPQDIPGVGRFAVVADPQGAAFVLFKGMDGTPPPSPPPGTPGHVGWHELHAADHEAVFGFYATLFGWTLAEAIPMGEMGVYQLFATGAAPVGGMMNKNAAMPVPAWLYYVNVDDAAAAAERIKAHGGQVLMGPHQVPGGSWIVQGLDPQGALFAVVGPGH